MKFCPSCGAELKEGAKFCASCGFQIQSQAAPPPPPQYQEPQQTFEPKEATSAFTDAITGKTNIVQRVINILTKPKLEWPVINNEIPSRMKLLFGYVMILALIPTLVTLLNFGLIARHFQIGYVLLQALISLIIPIVIIFLTTVIVEALVPSFDSEKNFDRSFQLICYASTPIWIVSILYFIPNMTVIRLSELAGFGYCIYLIINGLKYIKRTPEEKTSGYGALVGLSIILQYYIFEHIRELIL